MLDAALGYLRAGYPIIPITPRGKKPLLDSWLEYQSRLPTETEVTGWFERWPDANIAILTGDLANKLVADIDPEHGGDVQTIQAISPTALVSKTGSGFHLWYEYSRAEEPTPEGLGNRAGVLPGVDIRGEGGYVIVPPSVHESGEVYSWFSSGRAGRITASLRSLVQQRNGTGGDPSGPYGPNWLESVLGGNVQGTRNDAAARLSGYLAGKGVALDVAKRLLAQWNNDNHPPLSSLELQRTVESIYRTHQRRNGQGANNNGQSPATMRFLSFEEYSAHYGTQATEWTIEGWLPAHTTGLMVAPPGHFKTWLLLDLAISVASGMPFLGVYPVRTAGPVLFIQQEDHHGLLAERMGLIYLEKLEALDLLNTRPESRSEGQLAGSDQLAASDQLLEAFIPPTLPLFVYPDREFRFDNPDMMELLHGHIEEKRPVLTIIDPLYSAASTQNFMADAIQHMMALKRWRDEYGTSFFLAHHTRKSASADGSREEGWGSQFLNAWLETGYQIRSIGGSDDEQRSILLNRHFKQAPNAPRLSLTFDIKTGSDFSYEVVPEDASLEDLVRSALSEGALKPKELAERLNMRLPNLRVVMDALTTRGIVVLDAGHYSLSAIDENTFS